MVRYPVVLEVDDNNTVLVSFPDFPEAHTFGENKKEALVRAVDALETVIDAYIRERRPIPEPSATTGAAVELPALVATKVQLYEAMREGKVNKTELARRLNAHMPQIDRLLDIRHGSKLDQLEAAAKALGGRLEVSVVMPNRVLARGRVSDVRVLRAGRSRMRVHPGVLTASRRAPGVSRKMAGKKR